MTRQAAAQVADEMVAKGYVERRPHPTDARAGILTLPEKGRACTRAAETATTETIRPGRRRSGTAACVPYGTTSPA